MSKFLLIILLLKKNFNNFFMYNNKMENIHNFLNASKELGVKPDNLFQTSDLYEGTDMNKVE